MLEPDFLESLMLRFLTVVSVALLCAITAPAEQSTHDKVVPLPAEQWAANHITPPKLLHGELRDYPVEARLRQIDGLCLLTMVVDTKGNPQDIRIVHCTDSSFEGTSLDAAGQAQFQPATAEDGKPVPVTVKFVHQYHFLRDYLHLRLLLFAFVDLPVASLIPDRRVGPALALTKSDINHALSMPIEYGFVPVGDGPTTPDADGVYTQTRTVTGPRVVKFSDQGYGSLAFYREGSSACDVRVTVDEKGKASDPEVVRCAAPELEKVVVASLLKSSYRPGYVRGKVVAMRGVIHVNYGDGEDGTRGERGF